MTVETKRARLRACAALLAAVLAAPATQAQFDPTRVRLEPPQVEARFPAPAQTYATPAFDPWQADFTSHAQMMARLQALVGRPAVHLQTVGESGQGRALPMVLLA